MEFKIENRIPNAKVTVDKNDSGVVSIVISEEAAEQPKRILGDVKRGEVITLGDRKYIVLGHGADTTAIFAAENFRTMEFGQSADYRESDVRKYCNDEVYKELAAVVGAENIISHTVKLMADDGTFKGVSCKDNISILTTDLYRRYREFIPEPDESFWTATRVSEKAYARGVCCVGSGGILGWGGCGGGDAVRPFCILNSSLSIS